MTTRLHDPNFADAKVSGELLLAIQAYCRKGETERHALARLIIECEKVDMHMLEDFDQMQRRLNVSYERKVHK